MATTNCKKWNDAFAVGTLVHYFPIKDRSGYIASKTRSTAWALSDGSVVVKIEGRSGAVSVEHLLCSCAPRPRREKHPLITYAKRVAG